ncbi:hypothetical protein Pfo_019690 [Paulownia fortunei]|nr:hypothetical protein Pfo_019690 [Paulownia fortunei]
MKSCGDVNEPPPDFDTLPQQQKHESVLGLEGYFCTKREIYVKRGYKYRRKKQGIKTLGESHLKIFIFELSCSSIELGVSCLTA